MHFRIQKYGIRLLLEQLRDSFPDSHRYAVEYLEKAIEILHVYLDTVPSFQPHWLTLLGDLSTFWLSIEENHASRATFSEYALFWYQQVASPLPENQLSHRFLGLLEQKSQDENENTNIHLFDVADDEASPTYERRLLF
jgi:hypothetical protein